MKVIFIIIDALRWDYMSLNGFPYPTTPNIDKIAETAYVFDNAYATINQTDQSLTSIFSSTYPFTHGLEQHAAFLPKNELKTLNAWNLTYLPQILHENGFHTYGIDWLHRWHQWGYDWYHGRDEQATLSFARRMAATFPRAAKIGARFLRKFGGSLTTVGTKPGVDAQTSVDMALRILDGNDKDSYIFLHFWDAHTPYIPPHTHIKEMGVEPTANMERDPRKYVQDLCKSREYKAWALEYVVGDATSIGDLVAQYCSAIRRIDQEIGRLYQYLRDHDLIDETVLILTSDHGENLFEDHYFIEHSGVSQRVIHVPLIMHLPEYSAARFDELVSHVDVVPTLVDYLSLDVEYPCDGVSLIPLITKRRPLQRDYIYFQTRKEESYQGIIHGQFKYVEAVSEAGHLCNICGKNHRPLFELYDLLSDPFEKNNLAPHKRQLVQKMSALLSNCADDSLSRIGDDYNRRKAGYSHEHYSAKDKATMERQLRLLGYLD